MEAKPSPLGLSYYIFPFASSWTAIIDVTMPKTAQIKLLHIQDVSYDKCVYTRTLRNCNQ